MDNQGVCPFCGVVGADGWAVEHKPDCFIRLLFNKIQNTRQISDAELTEAWNTRIGEDAAVAAEREWISVDERLPKNGQRVFVLYKNEYNKVRRTIAEYINAKTVLAEDYLDPDYTEDWEEYDEENDCYWTPEGFYESQYATDMNWYLGEKILYWMPLPPPPKPSGGGAHDRLYVRS